MCSGACGVYVVCMWLCMWLCVWQCVCGDECGGVCGNVVTHDPIALSLNIRPSFICLRVFSQANGYFELSSNRRDIWSGADMAGDGQRRAQWNSALLSDVIAPSYVRLLIQVKIA